MERRRIQFTGRVQGVGFRATTRSVAGGFEVTGWVRNEPDGSVVAEVQGEAGEIERFLASLRAEMGRNIRSEFILGCTPERAETGFEVRR
jgi:acylphosphatase